MRRLLAEPLLHFAVLGTLLAWLAGGWEDRGPAPPERGSLVAPRQDLGAAFQSRYGRAPTPDELEAEARRWTDDEVFYREALALGLDQDDPVIRGRLIEKMRFLTRGAVAAAEPTTVELEQRLQTDPQRYAVPERISLEHVFVRAGPGAGARADELLGRLGAGTDPSVLGDPLPLGGSLRHKTHAQIAARLGRGFAEALGGLETATWVGPIASSYGLHLVRELAREAGRAATADEARPAIRAEVLAQRRRAAERTAVGRLRARYGGEEP